MLAAWRTQTPCLMRGESHGHGRPRDFGTRLKRAVLPSVLRRIDGFLAIGSWNEEYWRGLGVAADRIRTAYYSVDNAYFSAMSGERKDQARVLRSKWGVPPDGTVFLYCAKLVSAKAPPLCDACTMTV